MSKDAATQKKRCVDCKKLLPIELFAKRKGRPSPWSYCKKCNAKRAAAYAKKNPDRYAFWQAQSKEARQAAIRKHKSRPCHDCGKSYPFYVMDFDHRNGGEKSFGMASAHKGRGIDVILKEIAKCDVVCANCHRERTHQRIEARRAIRPSPPVA